MCFRPCNMLNWGSSSCVTTKTVYSVVMPAVVLLSRSDFTLRGLMLSFSGPRQEKRLNHKLPRPLRGVITAMVTPLNQDLSLDCDGLERLMAHLIEGGVHGIFILGTTGEAPNLPYSVRSELIERSCKLAGAR